VLPQGRRTRDAGGRRALEVDLDLAGIKAQVLGRIEELETREREREELLSELGPAMEARGYDAVAVAAAMGG
jgi:hypothetical protein